MHLEKSDAYDYEAAETNPNTLLNNSEVTLKVPAEEWRFSSSGRLQQSWLPEFISNWTTSWQRRASYTSISEENERRNPGEVEEDFRDDMSGITLLEGTARSNRQRYRELLHQVHCYIVLPFPSFVHRFMIKTKRSEGIRRSTDYLDGLRGVASLFVFIDHYLNGLHGDFEEWGYGQGQNRSFFQLPFVKLIYAGSCMVAIFFIVSGYVLSHRCVIAMRTDKHDKLYTALTSMTFRRSMRLFLPSVMISFLGYLAVCFNFIKSEIPRKHWTLWKETWHYIRYINEDLFKLWTWEINYKGFYSPQLWTIPLEFKCSLVLFLFILMVSRCRASVRLLIESVFITYLFFVQRWDVALFITGMFIAELNVIRDEKRQKQQDALENLNEKPLALPRKSKWQTIPIKLFLWAMLVLGAFIGGYPHGDAQHTPGYSWMANMWNDDDWEWKWRFWLAISAILIVLPTSFLPSAQSLFTTRIARYLGKISYSLYLVHGIMGRTLRPFLWHLFWKVLHTDGKHVEKLEYKGGWIIGTLVYVPLVFWAADVFARAVDGPTVKLAKWVEGRCFKGKNE